MKKLIVGFIFFLGSYSSFAASGQTYARFDYGLGQFTNDKFDSFNTKPNGSTFGASIGSKMNYVELGLFYRKMSLQAEINHDGTANKITHDGKTFGIDMNVFLNKYLSLKLGYAFNSYKEKLETPVSTQALNSIKTLYGLEENYSKSNVFYGANVDVFGAKKIDLYASVLHFPMGDSKSTTTAQLGIRIYMDLKLSDFFGSN